MTGTKPRRVAIAAPHHLAVAAAERIVGAGGNAVDAAVAAAVTLTVVYPHQCSIGGDLFAVVRLPDGSRVAVDASGAYGSGPRPDGVVEIQGPLSVSVPGAVSGWAELLRVAGSLPLDVLVAPAVEAASEGFVVGADLAEAVAEAASTTDPGLREMITGPDGRPLVEGAVLRQPRVAAVIADLARDGFRSLYDGDAARRLVAAFERLGVPVTGADLARHEVRTGAPLTARLDGCRVDTAHPSSQGYLFPRAELLAARLRADGVDVTPAVWAAIFRHCGARRDAELADRQAMRVPAAELLEPEQIATEARDLKEGARGGVKPTGDTVAVTAVSDDGTAVSLIQSLFHSFGSGLRDLDTGIVLHNRAASFSADPASPNAIAPGKRPLHTLMPVLLEYDDGRVSAHGAMGGRAQPQIHSQLLARVREGLSPQEAVAAPRFVVGGLGAGEERDIVLAESDLPEATLASLREAGMPVTVTAPRDSDVGHAMVASLAADGALSAGADPRSDGATFVST